MWKPPFDFPDSKKPLEIQGFLRWAADGASARGAHSPTLQHYKKLSEGRRIEALRLRSNPGYGAIKKALPEQDFFCCWVH